MQLVVILITRWLHSFSVAFEILVKYYSFLTGFRMGNNFDGIFPNAASTHRIERDSQSNRFFHVLITMVFYKVSLNKL
jgi:hypothetical protein